MPGWKERLKRQATDMLNLPPDTLLDIPRITCVGTGNVVVENARGLLKVEQNQVLINLGEQILVILGRDFEVTLVTEREIHLKGTLEQLEFAQNGRDLP